MLTANITILKEGVSVGVADMLGTPWAEFYLVGERADKVIDAIVDVITKCEPIRGDKKTLALFNRKKKGKKK